MLTRPAQKAVTHRLGRTLLKTNQYLRSVRVILQRRRTVNFGMRLLPLKAVTSYIPREPDSEDIRGMKETNIG